MGMKWVDLLTFSILKDAKIIAGINGLNREIKSVSVYDCLKQDDFTPDEKGTLYISLFEQYKDNPQQIFEWICSLNQNKVSGICTVDDGVAYLTDEVIRFCNNSGFPIVSINRDITYAEIIENISVLLYFDDLHIINEKKIDIILYDKLSQREILDQVRKINPGFKSRVKVISISGSLQSDIDIRRLNHILDKDKQNYYIKYKNCHLMIFSDENDDFIESKIAATKSMTSSMFENPFYGEGEICEISQFDRAIKSALTALKISELTGTHSFKYDRMEDFTLLMLIKDTKEAREFHSRFLDKILEYDKSGKKEFVKCIREYVLNRGEYHIVAEKLFQHENTIRYRINKIKSILGLEDDTIKFNELISIFVTIDSLLEK